MIPGRARSDRARVDDEAARSKRLRDPLRDEQVGDGRTVREHHEDDVGIRGRLGWRDGSPCTSRPERRGCIATAPVFVGLMG
jgi:hypothetical protein